MSGKVETLWPAQVDGRRESYAALRQRFETLLQASGIEPVGFSHVGFVVPDVQAALEALAAGVDPAWREAKVVWGAAFGCHIAKRVQDGCEYEFIQPVEESFLRRHLRDRGAGVQHLSFEVRDIRASLDALVAAGAEMADPKVHAGLHGHVAFVRPAGFGGLCLELCQRR